MTEEVATEDATTEDISARAPELVRFDKIKYENKYEKDERIETFNTVYNGGYKLTNEFNLDSNVIVYYLIKDLIISLVLGGTITAVILDILNYIVCDATFKMSEFLSFTGASFAFGAIIGVAYRCISGGGLVEHTGVTLYNTYAGIHNTFLFASAGGDYSYGATASIIGIFITILFAKGNE